jgi:hypothetical protein
MLAASALFVNLFLECITEVNFGRGLFEGTQHCAEVTAAELLQNCSLQQQCCQ